MQKLYDIIRFLILVYIAVSIADAFYPVTYQHVAGILLIYYFTWLACCEDVKPGKLTGESLLEWIKRNNRLLVIQLIYAGFIYYFVGLETGFVAAIYLGALMFAYLDKDYPC